MAMEDECGEGGKVVVGSRAWMKEESKATRTFLRTILMHLFHVFVSVLVSRSVNDTQCGFKLFDPVSKVGGIEGMHLNRWAFDVEVVVRSEILGYMIKEVPVKWKEIEGSKLTEEGLKGEIGRSAFVTLGNSLRSPPNAALYDKLNSTYSQDLL